MTLPIELPILLTIAAAMLVPALTPRLAVGLSVVAATLGFLFYAVAAQRLAGGAALAVDFWSVPSLGIAGGLRLDGLSLLFALLIAGIGALVLLYAGRYLQGHPGLRSLIAALLVFMAAMLGAVSADDVVTLFVFWELTSIASFFLVGFDHERPGARRAALQALLVTGGGGLALLAGLLLVAIATGPTSLSGIIAARDAVLTHPAAAPAMLLIIVGCFTKSAQVPFHFWLPNAMAAPTPVSAYLHSATMVKLGIYLLARMNPVYQDGALWQSVLTWFGLATAATGALLALRETDLKRVLAHTTVTSLGTLTMLIGIAPALSATAAVTFLLVHALYKASLFLVVGIVDHETGSRDARALGGLAKSMPLTAAVALLAALSMAGLPPFVGFVAKELVYEAKIGAGSFATILVVTGFLVNAAMFAIAALLSWRLFYGAERPTPRAPHDPHAAMLTGPALLALLGLAAGAAPAMVGSSLVDPAAAAILGVPAEVELALWHGFTPILVLSIATAVAGIGLFLIWEGIAPRLKSVALIDRWGPAACYDRLLAALVHGSERVTRIVQHDSLRGYLQTLFAVTAIATAATLVLRGGVSDLSFSVPAIDIRALVFVGLVAGAVATVLAPTIFIAVVAMGLVGFATALVFLLFGAPDVALTQFAVEILLVAILATTLVRLPIRQRDTRSPRDRLADAGVALAMGGAVSLLLIAALAEPFDPRLSLWFGAESLPSAHGRNVVNVILVDFRALDTLGEIAVLAISAFAVLALLRRPPRQVKS